MRHCVVFPSSSTTAALDHLWPLVLAVSNSNAYSPSCVTEVAGSSQSVGPHASGTIIRRGDASSLPCAAHEDQSTRAPFQCPVTAVEGEVHKVLASKTARRSASMGARNKCASQRCSSSVRRKAPTTASRGRAACLLRPSLQKHPQSQSPVLFQVLTRTTQGSDLLDGRNDKPIVQSYLEASGASQPKHRRAPKRSASGSRKESGNCNHTKKDPEVQVETTSVISGAEAGPLTLLAQGCSLGLRMKSEEQQLINSLLADPRAAEESSWNGSLEIGICYEPTDTDTDYMRLDNHGLHNIDAFVSRDLIKKSLVQICECDPRLLLGEGFLSVKTMQILDMLVRQAFCFSPRSSPILKSAANLYQWAYVKSYSQLDEWAHRLVSRRENKLKIDDEATRQLFIFAWLYGLLWGTLRLNGTLTIDRYPYVKDLKDLIDDDESWTLFSSYVDKVISAWERKQASPESDD